MKHAQKTGKEPSPFKSPVAVLLADAAGECRDASKLFGNASREAGSWL